MQLETLFNFHMVRLKELLSVEKHTPNAAELSLTLTELNRSDLSSVSGSR